MTWNTEQCSAGTKGNDETKVDEMRPVTDSYGQPAVYGQLQKQKWANEVRYRVCVPLVPVDKRSRLNKVKRRIDYDLHQPDQYQPREIYAVPDLCYRRDIIAHDAIHAR